MGAWVVPPWSQDCTFTDVELNKISLCLFLKPVKISLYSIANHMACMGTLSLCSFLGFLAIFQAFISFGACTKLLFVCLKGQVYPSYSSILTPKHTAGDMPSTGLHATNNNFLGSIVYAIFNPH